MTQYFGCIRCLEKMSVTIFRINTVLSLCNCIAPLSYNYHKAKLITKTRLYNFDPLKPHFYIVKLGFTGYTLFFSYFAKNIDCGYPQSIF